MKYSAEDAAHTTFVRLSRPHLGPQASVVLSRAALHLHTFGVLSSIESSIGPDPDDTVDTTGITYTTGTPEAAGFVSDGYLNAISAETSISALELCLIGLWHRVAGGYRVEAGDIAQVRGRIRGQLRDLATRCRRDGGHHADREHPGMCARCGAPARPH